jgi:hypothetical protein
MTVLRRALTLLASGTLAMVLAGSAVASPSADRLPAWACSAADLAVAASTHGAAARGGAPRGTAVDSAGRIREKDTGQVVHDLPASARGRAPASFAVTVAVYWHVIHDGAEGAITDSQIRDQMRVMNAAYSGGGGGADTGFAFQLAGITRTDDAVWYASHSAGAEHEFKHALKQGGDNALNVYSTSGGGYLGYAYLPEITDTAQAYLDGIVIDWRTLPFVSDIYGGGYANEGDTLVHEAGHWLNLERRRAAPRARTPARRPAWTRSTTTWTTRTTRASTSSRRARSSACATRGSSGERAESGAEGGIRTHDRRFTKPLLYP